MHCGSRMSWTGSASQDLETACSVAKNSLLLQQLKSLIWIVGSIFITVVNWNALI